MREGLDKVDPRAFEVAKRHRIHEDLDAILLEDGVAFARIERDAAAGNAGARELVSYFVGQGVGLVEQVRSSRQVVQDFREEFIDAVGGLMAAMDTQ